MSNKQELMAMLRSFSQNVRKFKKLISAEKKFDENEPQFKRIIESNQQLLESIPKIFKKIYQSRQDNVSIDKIKKQYESIKSQMTDLLEQYHDELRQLEKLENKSVMTLRKTLSNINEQLRRTRIIQANQKDEDSQRGISVEIKMHEVNQQTLHYERMIEIKEKEIKVIKGRMVDALKVQEDMKSLVYSQGKKLDVAEDNINNANLNVHQAHENLIEGRDQHVASKKKKCCIFSIVIAILLVILIPILIKFT